MNQNIYKHVVSLSLLLIALLLLINWHSRAYANSSHPNQTIQVDPQLLADMEKNGRSGYLIYFRGDIDLTPAHDMDWETRGHYVVDTLQAAATASQQDVRLYLDKNNIHYTPFWIDNIIVVQESDTHTLNSLLNFSEIKSIKAQREVYLFEPDEVEDSFSLYISNQSIEPNISRVNAPDVWDMGITGQGIIVATIDTGARYTHEALMGQYRGNLGNGQFDHNYHWWDPYNANSEPFDPNNHGTHVVGTIVGDDGADNQIGMAPGAKWMACIGFLPSATDAGLLECAQFLTAPWDLNGENPDPAMRPHIINNSWGSCGHDYDPWYQGVVDAWVAAGIYPIFANGNQRSGCPVEIGSVGTPARYGNVTGVGALGRDNGTLANYSLWGPSDVEDTINPRGYPFQKPQVSAPGTNRSSLRNDDTAYGSYQGTSMAAPHVSGLVALIWSVAPCLVGDYAATETIIEKTAVSANVGPLYPGHANDGPDGIPNQATGWGEIDALAAVINAIHICQLTGTLITGQVTDSVNGEPLPNAHIEAHPHNGDSLKTITNQSGLYLIPFVPPDTYTITARLFGYETAVIPNITVITDTVSQQDITLIPALYHTITGTVTDSHTGWPLYARIDVLDSPLPPTWTNPATGSYRLDLPEGDEHTIRITSWTTGYNEGQWTIGPLFANQINLFTLTPDLAACTAPGYTLDYIYVEVFNQNDGNYSVAGTSPAPWQYGQPATWPFACAVGDTCWGTNLNGNYYNNAAQMLLSVPIDLTTVPTDTQLIANWHQAWHIESFAWDQAYAEVSINGGPWEPMWHNPEATTQADWSQLSYDISAAAGGTVQFRWRLISDSSIAFNGLYIDKVTITEAEDCTPQVGGLVVGNVYDANTKQPLRGASVINDAYTVLTQDVPLDPQVDDGFYIIFMPEGLGELEASMVGGYGPETAVIEIITNTVVSQPFNLQAGWLQTTPAALETAVSLGSNYTLPLTITNAGNLPAQYSLMTTILSQEFESDFAPHGWQIINHDGDCVWQRNDQIESGRPNYAGGDGFSATADSDNCGRGTVMDTELRTPPLDLSSATVAQLNFIAAYRHLDQSDFRVRVSTDGGQNWTNLLHWAAHVSPEGPGQAVTLDLTPYTGYNNVTISFHYRASAWNWWVQIDQLHIIADQATWLTATPQSDIIAAQSQRPITITIDTTTLTQPGLYESNLLFIENTPYHLPPIPIKVWAEQPTGPNQLIWLPIITHTLSD